MRESVRVFPAQGHLGSWEPRSHRATNLMQKVYWREIQNGSSFRTGRETVGGWMEGRAFVGYLESVQWARPEILLTNVLTLEHCVDLEAEVGIPKSLSSGLSQGQGDFLLACSPTIFPFCFLLITNHGSGKRVTLSLNYFLLYGGIKVLEASFTIRAPQADNRVRTSLRSS